MREKKINIDGKKIIVKEIKTDDIDKLFESEEGTTALINLIAGGIPGFKQIFPLCVDLKEDEIAKVTKGINSFSILEKAVREVNADFFLILPERLKNLKASVEIFRLLEKRSAG